MKTSLNKKVVNFLFTMILMVGISSLAIAGEEALEDGRNTCGVPVCDIEAALKQIELTEINKRGEYAMKMQSTFEKEKDVKVLTNLYEYSKRLVPLYAELFTRDQATSGDAWVTRAVDAFYASVLFNMANSGTFEYERIHKYFLEMNDGGTRNSTIEHWWTKSKTEEDVDTLVAMIRFATQARERCIAAGDADWVARNATYMINEITARLTQIDPAHEGIYEATMKSVSGNELPFDRIVVLGSSSTDNLIVSFINSELDYVVQSFSSAELEGSVLRGTKRSDSTLATKFQMVYDRITGKAEGYLMSANDGYIEFKAQQRVSTSSIFRGKAPYEVNKYMVTGGPFKGEIAGVAGTLHVKTYRENVYSANFRANDGSLILYFEGKFFPKNAILSLTSKNSMKLVLSLRDRDGVVGWHGVVFNANNALSFDAFFER